MGMLDGRVAIVDWCRQRHRTASTQLALARPRAGAAVVVNDLGGASDGSGNDGSPAGRGRHRNSGRGRPAPVANASDVGRLGRRTANSSTLPSSSSAASTSS